MHIPQPGEYYMHYKGKEYRIIACARLESTLEEVVVYEGQYTDPEFGSYPIWVRPLKNFLEEITIQSEEGNELKFQRFQRINH